MQATNWIACWLILASWSATFLQAQGTPNLGGGREALRTSYQQAGPYRPQYDLRTDAVMVYGISDASLETLGLWREKSGSHVQLMTGVAWGTYADFLNGKFDGETHHDDAQVDAAGQPILHGTNVPYLVPSTAFGDYLEARLQKVVDAGVDTIFLEEPEIWAYAGFGETFQRLWQVFYHEPWTRPDATCDAQYRSAKLKQALYRTLLDRLSRSLKEYSLKKYQRPLSVYVATHSLVSYAQIQMVSPESSLLDLPGVDGLIAQVWTGTARFPNYYQGVETGRTFEAAFLEYNVMQEMTRGTGKRLYFLNDPVEDDLKHDWNDYRKNYLDSLVASLMQSDTHFYEVCPWPSRVFLGRFPAGSPNATPIPETYATTLALTFQQLRDMAQPDVHWDGATEGIGVLLSDSAMFQRSAPTVRDTATQDVNDSTCPLSHDIDRLNSFFGMTMPLVKHGIPVEVPVLDHVLRFPGYLDKFKVLVLSYEFQKPLHPGIHASLADWVRRGGVLVYLGAETDPYHAVREWWNQGIQSYASPSEHLFTLLGLDRHPENGRFLSGNGTVFVARTHPAWFTRSAESANAYRQLLAQAVAVRGEKLVERNYFLKYRGPYVLAAVMNESFSAEPLVLNGRFVNLFDPELRVVDRVTLQPSERAWLLDLNRVTAQAPAILASSGRVEKWTVSENGVQCVLSAPQGIVLASRILLPSKPQTVCVDGASLPDFQWDAASRTLYLKHPTQGMSTIEMTY